MNEKQVKEDGSVRPEILAVGPSEIDGESRGVLRPAGSEGNVAGARQAESGGREGRLSHCHIRWVVWGIAYRPLAGRELKPCGGKMLAGQAQQ